jgi:putative Mg2+ transporter-C (MgtC) family protein
VSRIDDHHVLFPVLRLGLALLLALPLGWERDQRRRSAGLRTHALLSMGVCGFLLLGQKVAGGPAAEADAFYGVLLGMGFVGSGAVVASGERARGSSTAASLWVTGAIGAGVAYGSTLVAAAVSLLSVVALAAPSLARKRKATS